MKGIVELNKVGWEGKITSVKLFGRVLDLEFVY